MNTWVLILTLVGQHAAIQPIPGFANIDACATSGIEWAANMEKHHLDASFVCVNQNRKEGDKMWGAK